MADRSFVCPECERPFPTAARLAAHRRLAPDHSRPAKEGTKEKAASRAERTPDQVVDQFVGNLQDLGVMLAASVAPHLGVTIAGVENPLKPGEWLVRSRAVMAGNLIRDRARKSLQTVRLLMAFNRLFEVPEGFVLATSLPVALALDTGRMTIDATIELPLRIRGRAISFQPAPMLIGDVIAYLKAEGAYEGASQNGAAAPSEPAAAPSGIENT